jgi:hypothetical protein
MIKTVILDLGGVIVPLDFARGYAAIECVCPYPAVEVPRRIAATGLVQKFEIGQVEPQEFVREISAALELKLGFDGFCDLWGSIFLRTR